MKLFYLWQNYNNDYDTYDSCVVAAESEEDAKTIYPSDCELKMEYDEEGFYFTNLNGEKWRLGSNWAKHPDQVKAEYLGEAKEGTERGIICASFNAG